MSELSRQNVEVRRYGACDDDIMLCGLRLVWREFCSEIFIDLSIRYQYQITESHTSSL